MILRCKRPLLNHLVRYGEQRRRDGETEQLGSIPIDDKFELDLSHHRQVGGLFTLKNAAGINADMAKAVCAAWTVAHQPTDFRVCARAIRRRNPMMDRER